MKRVDMHNNLLSPFARRFKKTFLNPMPAYAVSVGLKTDFLCQGAVKSCSGHNTPPLFLKNKCMAHFRKCTWSRELHLQEKWKHETLKLLLLQGIIGAFQSVWECLFISRYLFFSTFHGL